MIELINPANKSAIEKTEQGYIDKDGKILSCSKWSALFCGGK